MRNLTHEVDSRLKRAFVASIGVVFLAGTAGYCGRAAAQLAEDEESVAAAESARFSPEELEELVGPIALYPDDLIGIILPAATYPLDVVEAARLLDEREQDSSLRPDEEWDDSVVALLNYPEVLRLMDEDLDWTWDLGEAFLTQQADVLDAVQRFREQARAAGNLESNDRQVVREDDGVIEIEPADPKVVYVPYYEPRRVIVHYHEPIYWYPRPYPVYYYPYPPDYGFHAGFFFGVTSAFVIGWHSHFLHVHHHLHVGHPYYHYRYYEPYYVRRNVSINVVNVSNAGYVWRPHYRHGVRPHRVAVTRYEGGSRAGYSRSTEGRPFGTPRGTASRNYGVRDGGARIDSGRAQARAGSGSRTTTSRLAPSRQGAAAGSRAAEPGTRGTAARTRTAESRAGRTTQRPAIAGGSGRTIERVDGTAASSSARIASALRERAPSAATRSPSRPSTFAPSTARRAPTVAAPSRSRAPTTITAPSHSRALSAPSSAPRASAPARSSGRQSAIGGGRSSAATRSGGSARGFGGSRSSGRAIGGQRR